MLETLFFCVLKIQFLSRFQVQFLCVLKIQFLWTKSDCLPVCRMAVGFGNIICPHEGALLPCVLLGAAQQLSSPFCWPWSIYLYSLDSLGPCPSLWTEHSDDLAVRLVGSMRCIRTSVFYLDCWAVLVSYLLRLNAVVDVIVIGFLVLSVFLLLLWSTAAVLVSATLTCPVLLAFLLFLSSNRNTDFMESTRKWFCGCHKYSSKYCECWYF